MLAVRIHPDGLELEDIPTPTPGPGEVLVRVHAAALTRDELEWPTDRLPAIPSYELSGRGRRERRGGLRPDPVRPRRRRRGVRRRSGAVLAPKPAALDPCRAAAVPMGGSAPGRRSSCTAGLEPGRARHRHRRLGGRRPPRGADRARLRSPRSRPSRRPTSSSTRRAASIAGGGTRIVTIVSVPRRREAVRTSSWSRTATNCSSSLGSSTLSSARRSTRRSPLADAPAAFKRLSARGKRGKVVLDVAGS